MSLLDSADLLARCRRLANRPTTDEWPTSDDWYAWLTDAQLYWLSQLAVHVPEKYYVTVTLTSSDGGYTYDFPAEPIGAHIEVRASRSGAVLVPGPDFDPGCDYVMGASKISFPGGKSRSFPNGPVARYIPTPGVISAVVEPSLVPVYARQLFVPRACYLWALTPGTAADPRTFLDLEAALWAGEPNRAGDTGILGAVKQEFFLAGAAAIPGSNVQDWWRFVDNGSGYIPSL